MGFPGSSGIKNPPDTEWFFWFGKIPQAAEQPRPWTATPESVLWSPGVATTEGGRLEKPPLRAAHASN